MRSDLKILKLGPEGARLRLDANSNHRAKTKKESLCRDQN